MSLIQSNISKTLKNTMFGTVKNDSFPKKVLVLFGVNFLKIRENHCKSILFNKHLNCIANMI